MAFLAPLLFAALAVTALPVLLHLRKNRPKQTVAFSTLMFLEPTPPVVKSRPRLEDILLLILRLLAVVFLVLAFTRPFFRAKESTPPAMTTGLDFILIDTSASMRGEPSATALQIANRLIDSFPEQEAIATATFADSLRSLLDPVRARSLPPGERKAAARASLANVAADWRSTRLDTALLAAIAAAGPDGRTNLHVIGDLQNGSTLERLRNENWPGAVQVILHPVTPDGKWSNAGVQMLPMEKSTRRARVSNSEGSAKTGFTLKWDGAVEPVRIEVPAGASSVFDAPPGIPAEGKVTLSGDDFSYDNEASWITPELPVARVWYPDQAPATDTREAAYFLNRALRDTPDYRVEITAGKPATPPALIIAGGATDVTGVLKDGGQVLFPLADAASVQTLATLLGERPEPAREAVVKDHALFGGIDFKSAVFAPFADARYSDFSSVRIWKYRVIPAGIAARGQILARFDSGDPAWIAFSVGKGTLHALATTWRPADSQLALTPKFPALLHGLLAASLPANPTRGIGVVGDTFPTPGIHGEGPARLAIQLDPAESERTPLPESELRALGVPLDPPVDLVRAAEVSQAVSDADQESRQRLGWWALVAAAIFFIAETLLAGFQRQRPNPVTP